MSLLKSAAREMIWVIETAPAGVNPYIGKEIALSASAAGDAQTSSAPGFIKRGGKISDEHEQTRGRHTGFAKIMAGQRLVICAGGALRGGLSLGHDGGLPRGAGAALFAPRSLPSDAHGLGHAGLDGPDGRQMA